MIGKKINHQEGVVNWGEGNRWQVDPIELKNKSQKILFSNPIGSNRFEVGVYPICMASSHWANIPEAIRRCLGTIYDAKRGDKS